ncbi:aminotransferase class I/II-fold pyridoxal phosphate-dependent enzyme [Eubacterium sp. 1001713B170207_170306_E7]|uniref:aminotransferase class I/II-fold pyridoxal phosphate-dependent enzyme n=1 Tax=Eubacterium sp. 1001713B170207_170306_E7 TaxID=2787097 RepID=UPI00189A7343|nr:aminotransferase class I/II-fold pyridoxal phosphate-dependent enzyme [Eubacterium sp. 1001713B170207_170306_E7]
MKKGLLYTRLKELSDTGALRFHMPGHKGKNCFDNENWATLDTTEIPGADNLHDPSDILLRVQEKLASVYGSAEACILVGGSTAGIQSAIMGVCREGESLLVPLNCHRSVYAGLALGRIKGIYFEPQYDARLGFGKSVTPGQVEEQLRMHPEAKGMILVNPTYYGTISDVAAIAELLHKKGKVLIVDEAHGAHLRFCAALPPDAVACGADIVIQSTHKLLGAFTQSSLLHMQGPLVERGRVKKFLAMLQSSSPSYLLMMSVENAVDEACEKGEAVFQAIADRWDFYRKRTGADDGIALYAPERGQVYDKSKWLLMVKDGRGTDVEKRLLTDFNIQCEMSGFNYVLAMTGIGTTPDELDRLMAAVADMNRERPKVSEPPEAECVSLWKHEEKYPLWQALYNMEAGKLPLENAVGRAAAGFVIPYPPGIPVLLPGSLVTEETAAELLRRWKNGEAVVGIDHEGMIEVIVNSPF